METEGIPEVVKKMISIWKNLSLLGVKTPIFQLVDSRCNSFSAERYSKRSFARATVSLPISRC